MLPTSRKLYPIHVFGRRLYQDVYRKAAACRNAGSRYVMCEAIKEYYQKTGNKIGFKPAGGINTVNDAIIYYTIVKELLGEEWLDNQLFRLGTSRLANLLLSDIKGEEIKVLLKIKGYISNQIRLTARLPYHGNRRGYFYLRKTKDSYWRIRKNNYLCKRFSDENIAN